MSSIRTRPSSVKMPARAVTQGEDPRRFLVYYDGDRGEGRRPDADHRADGPEWLARAPAQRDRSAIPTTTPSRTPTPNAVAIERPGLSRTMSCEYSYPRPNWSEIRL